MQEIVEMHTQKITAAQLLPNPLCSTLLRLYVAQDIGKKQERPLRTTVKWATVSSMQNRNGERLFVALEQDCMRRKRFRGENMRLFILIVGVRGPQKLGH